MNGFSLSLTTSYAYKQNHHPDRVTVTAGGKLMVNLTMLEQVTTKVMKEHHAKYGDDVGMTWETVTREVMVDAGGYLFGSSSYSLEGMDNATVSLTDDKESMVNPNSRENIKVKNSSPKVISNTKEALDHYYYGNGESVDLSPNTAMQLITTYKFMWKHYKITHGLTNGMSGYFGVFMTHKVFHVGRTNVNYSINCKGNDCEVKYELFANDGFWDPDYILEYLTEGDSADGMGSNLEFLGGRPYRYNPIIIKHKFKNPGYED